MTIPIPSNGAMESADPLASKNPVHAADPSRAMAAVGRRM
jgi:hypothetical protein